MIPDKIKIEAKKGYCFPAVIEVLLKSYGYDDFDQCAIAKKLCKLAGQNMAMFVEDGLKLKPGILNSFFAENGFRLQENYISYTKMYDEYDFESRLQEYCTQGVFIICGYNYSRLFDRCKGTANHVSIVCSVNPKLGKITIFDPGPENQGYKEVDTDDLWCALKSAQAGIWCVECAKDESGIHSLTSK